MEMRLHAAGIHTVAALCAASKPTLRRAWNGVLGDRLWHLLRGEEIPDLVSAKQSIGHSHVLPPEHRPPEHAWPILCKLLHKACERLRSHGLLSGCLTLHLGYLRSASWAAEIRTAESDATLHFMHLLHRLWKDRPEPNTHLLKVGVTLTRLVEHHNHTPSLFDAVSSYTTATDEEKHRRLDSAIDKLRARYGRSAVYFGGIHDSRDAAPMRISFTHIPDIDVEQD
jgi:DNA polymerase-4